MKVIIFFLVIINIALVPLNVYFSNRKITPEIPTFSYSNSNKFLDYYISYNDFRIIQNLKDDNIQIQNKDGQKINLFELKGNSQWYIENALANWIKLPINNNFIELIPPDNCKFLVFRTIIKNNISYNLYRILNIWDTCIEN